MAYGDDNYDGYTNLFGDFGFDGGYNVNQKETLTTAKTKAVTTGDAKFQKVLDYILKYGSQALSVLVGLGVIKNKNLQSIQNADYDKTALDKVLSANGGTLVAPQALTTPTPTKTGISFNDPVTLILAGGLAYLLLKDKK